MERVLDGIPLYLKGVNNKVMSARVAQSVERSAVNRKVGGSNPPVSDIFNFYICKSITAGRNSIRRSRPLTFTGLSTTTKNSTMLFMTPTQTTSLSAKSPRKD